MTSLSFPVSGTNSPISPVSPPEGGDSNCINARVGVGQDALAEVRAYHLERQEQSAQELDDGVDYFSVQGERDHLALIQRSQSS